MVFTRRARLSFGGRPKKGDTMAAKKTSKKPTLTLLTLGLFAIAAAAPATRSLAKDVSATTLELSAQSDNPNANNPKKQGQPKTNVQPKQTIQKQQLNVQPKQQFQKKQVIIQSDKPRFQKNQQIQTQQNIQVQKKVIVVNPDGRRKFVGQPKVFKPAHNNLVYKFKLKGANQAFVNGKSYSVFHNNYRRRHNGRLYTFVGLALLAPLAIGAATYYPYAYLNVPEDYCSGLTEDGCEMVYREVETVEGDPIGQCTAYCPWQ